MGARWCTMGFRVPETSENNPPLRGPSNLHKSIFIDKEFQEMIGKIRLKCRWESLFLFVIDDKRCLRYKQKGLSCVQICRVCQINEGDSHAFSAYLPSLNWGLLSQSVLVEVLKNFWRLATQNCKNFSILYEFID